MNEMFVVNKNKLPKRGRNISVEWPSPLGNVMPIIDAPNNLTPSVPRPRLNVLEDYRKAIEFRIHAGDEQTLTALEEIAMLVLDDTGEPVNLVCECDPLPCHGDVIKEIVRELITKYSL